MKEKTVTPTGFWHKITDDVAKKLLCLLVDVKIYDQVSYHDRQALIMLFIQVSFFKITQMLLPDKQFQAINRNVLLN